MNAKAAIRNKTGAELRVGDSASISAILGKILPGAGALYRAQDLHFAQRVRVGDKLKVTVVRREKREEPVAVFDTRVVDAEGRAACKGVAEVEAPGASLVTEARDLPALIAETKDHFAGLIARAAELPKLKTVVVCPEDHNSLGGALLSAENGLMEPILVGDPACIHAAAAELGADVSKFALVAESDPHVAAARAVAMVVAGPANAVMKGDLHSDDLLAKVDIVQNAIDLARAGGLERPKVGVLSAVETITPNIPSTLAAAILSKVAERGQVRGGVVDGPLAMDNAIDVEAARTKGIVSLVAGHANVLIAPNLESGNMLAKELTFVARAEAAGLVVGAAAPVVLTSRADDDRARLASCALAQLYEYWRREGKPFEGAPGAATLGE